MNMINWTRNIGGLQLKPDLTEKTRYFLIDQSESEEESYDEEEEEEVDEKCSVVKELKRWLGVALACLLYTSPSPRD